MIWSDFGPTTAYRMHAPRWATESVSGAGAATHGGRANRPGTPALYLALDSQTAVREYQQLSPLMPPGTLVSYTVQIAPVLDFRAGYNPSRWPESWSGFNCDWRDLWFNQRTAPPSWLLAEEAMQDSAKGIVFASTLMPGGFNLVVYPNMLGAHDLIQVHDPAGMLPKNQRSWQ
ncbi:MAG: RES domain-containing protein [Burkholderiales bacterium]